MRVNIFRAGGVFRANYISTILDYLCSHYIYAMWFTNQDSISASKYSPRWV